MPASRCALRINAPKPPLPARQPINSDFAEEFAAFRSSGFDAGRFATQVIQHDGSDGAETVSRTLAKVRVLAFTLLPINLLQLSAGISRLDDELRNQARRLLIVIA